MAYHSLLVQRRKELHRLIGLAIEELYGERLAEHYEVLAHHFSMAEEWSRSLDYLLKAADKAARAWANREAIALYDQALQIAGRLGPAVDVQTVMDIRGARSDLYFLLSDFGPALAEAEALRELARQRGDPVTEGMALGKMAMASKFNHDLDGAIVHARAAIAVASEVDARPVLAFGHIVTGYVYWGIGQPEPAHEHVGQGLAVARSSGDAAHQSLALMMLAGFKSQRGEYADALGLLEEGLPLARGHNFLATLLHGLFWHGVTLSSRGDYDLAAASFAEGLALSSKVGHETWQHKLLNGLGWLHAELGDLDVAVDLNRQSAEGGRKRADHEVIGNAETNLGDVFLAKGDLPLAGDVLEGVHRLVRNPATSDWMKWRYSMHLFASLGELWLARGDTAKAKSYTEQCLELATRSSARKYVALGWRLHGEIALARRHSDEAEEALRRALEIAQGIGTPSQLGKIHLALGRVHGAAGRVEAASRAYRAARDIVERVKANLRDDNLRASFERAPMVRQLHALARPD